ncbi:MAG: ATPase, T2SS/T4P/T4SS family, partial [Nanoarchaeota archaeon]
PITHNINATIMTKMMIVIKLASKELLKDMQTLLLTYGIILRTGKRIERDKTIKTAISSLDSIKRFSEAIGFLQEYKTKKLGLLCKKVSTHDTTDTFNISMKTRQELAQIFRRKFNSNDYIVRGNNVGRKKLAALLKEKVKTNTLLKKKNVLKKLKILIEADIFWDEICEIDAINNFSGYVYDLSVPQCESFVCENIVAHNTLELPAKSLRELGFNIQQIKVAAALAKESTEMTASDGIRATLRLGDSALIVGEVRSKEAIALYEAMRIGAAANVVAGTIHSDSPYGVYDRVVNDIGVPKTSFKATDIIIVANPVKSADGLHKSRRITQITEVRKHWENDPMAEGGFMDLMKYNAKTDRLEATDAIISGESETLKTIASNIKEFAGNWDAVRDNIELRGKIKQAIVDYSAKTNNAEMLEAPFVIKCNDKFHLLSESIKEEIGYLDSKRIFYEWEEWIKREAKRV